MKQINIYERGDKVAILYEIDSLIFKNGQLYYKLKNPANGTYLDNAYTADELVSMPDVGEEDRKYDVEIRTAQ